MEHIDVTDVHEWDEEEPNAKKEALTNLEEETFATVMKILSDNNVFICDRMLAAHKVIKYAKEVSEEIEK